MDVLTVIGLLVLAVLLFKYVFLKKSAGNLPPGPPGKFLIGNLFDVSTDRLHVRLTEISGEHGDLYTLKIGGKIIVVVNSIEAFRELYEDDKYGRELDGRQKTFFTQVVSGGIDLALAQDSAGRSQRRTAMYTATRNFTQQHGHKLQEEAQHLLELLETKSGDVQDLTKPVQLYLANSLFTLLTGERYEYDDTVFRLLAERGNFMGVLIQPKVDAIMTMFPWLQYLPFGYGKLYQASVTLDNKLKELVFDPQKVSYNPNSLRGGIDHLLKVQKETYGHLASELSDDHLNMSAFSVVSAGAGPAKGALLYFIVIILNQPEIAEKLRKEMDSVLGRSRLPTLADRSRMTYAQAVVLELFRWISPAPLLVPRRADEDVQFRGYTIPKDATIITNAWKIHHDAAMWKNPMEFQPERFIGPNGYIISDLQNNLIAFGGGRRKCFGMDFAHDYTFLYVTSIVQRFEFEAPNGDLPTLDPRLCSPDSAGVVPEPFKVIIKPRTS